MGATTLGFWKPHTSSVDFCESNYAWTDYVVEPHNVWSSAAGISFWGLLGLWQSVQCCQADHPLSEHRVKVAFTLLVLIGLGSMGLHGTLHWIFQSSDELPMIYVVLVGMYSVWNLKVVQRGNQVALWLFAALVVTLVYYVFQEWYVVFLSVFTPGALGLIGQLICLAQTSRHQHLALAGRTIFVFIAIPVWILDMLLCSQGVLEVSNTWFGGATPHVIWHFCAGLGTYYLILFIVACRCEILRYPISVEFIGLGLIPILKPIKKL